MEIFLGQINKIMAENGLKSGAAFDRKAGLINKAARWFNPDWRGQSVDTDTLLTIAKNFQKSLDWLLFGEEPPLAPAELRSESDDARSLAPKEANLLKGAMVKIEEVLKEDKKKLRPEQMIRLLTRVYNDCAEDRIKPDSIMVKRYLSVLD